MEKQLITVSTATLNLLANFKSTSLMLPASSSPFITAVLGAFVVAVFFTK